MFSFLLFYLYIFMNTANELPFWNNKVLIYCNSVISASVGESI